jgi:hypothetical protein
MYVSVALRLACTTVGIAVRSSRFASGALDFRFAAPTRSFSYLARPEIKTVRRATGYRAMSVATGPSKVDNDNVRVRNRLASEKSPYLLVSERIVIQRAG